MSRVQLALNVRDIDSAVAFYSKLFNAQPAKLRSGYANFAIAEPPLKLVLIENKENPGGLNHLGVEVDTTDAVVAETRRLSGEGLPTAVEDGVECCYAKQDKVWVDSPDGTAWEIYTVIEHVEMPARKLRMLPVGKDSACCGTSEAQGVDLFDISYMISPWPRETSSTT